MDGDNTKVRQTILYDALKEAAERSGKQHLFKAAVDKVRPGLFELGKKAEVLAARRKDLEVRRATAYKARNEELGSFLAQLPSLGDLGRAFDTAPSLQGLVRYLNCAVSLQRDRNATFLS